MDIVIGNDLDDLYNYIDEDRKVFLLTDDKVYSIYGEEINKFMSRLASTIYIMNNGEENKNKSTVFDIYDKLISSNFGRYDLFIAFGGGVVGDIGGFVASTYMRGLDYIQIPTTLLSQVDSSLGAKTGFDYKGYKNIIGSFKKPLLTYINTEYLLSLSKEDFISGLGEILKYGIIHDYDFFKYVCDNREQIMSRKIRTLEYCVKKSVEIKSKFVNEDFRDFGLRRNLNFGHTIGHAIESFYGFKNYKHGQAVILGMIYESYIAYYMDFIDEDYFYELLEELSFYIKVINFREDEIKVLVDIMRRDKKNRYGNISMVLPTGRGKVDFYDDIAIEDIYRSLEGEWHEDKRKR